MKLRHIALRNLRRNTRRSILSMSAIAIAAMAFVFLFGMIEGMKADMGGAATMAATISAIAEALA